jgi:tetratricopeptide (TPR) repeat protein
MKQLVHLESTITFSARGAMRCPPLGRVFVFVAHLLACVALAPVAQACATPRDAWAAYVASYSFTANWHSLTGATSYYLDVSTSSSFDTYVSGYQNLNVGNVTHRSVTGLNPSTVYYFRVRAHRGTQICLPSNTVQVTTLSPTGFPVVITNPATLVASFSARLNGTVDPHGLTTTVYFQYGTTISYGLRTAIQSKTGNTYQNVAATIGGLTASTTYHFRIVATNSAGTRYGADRIFTTLSPTGPPVVITNPATLVTSFSATLNGSVDPHGLTTNVHFQYGTTTSYGHTTANQTKTGNAYQNVAANISGLSASTTYHFKIVATNSAGTRYGTDRTFTTLSATSPPVVITSPATNTTSSSATSNGSDDPELMASKASMYQAEGNLQEAAKLLIDVNERTTSVTAFATKLTQLRFERNHAEAIRLLQVRRAQVPSACDGLEMLHLAFAQRFVGDTAGAKVTAQQLRNTLEPLCKEQPDNPDLEVELALADAVLGERDSALKEAERAIMLVPSAKDAMHRPGYEEILALIQTIIGENSRAISTLTQLLKTPYGSVIYGPAPVTPALLRLDPLWDPLRTDPAFQKLCEEKQPPATP